MFKHEDKTIKTPFKRKTQLAAQKYLPLTVWLLALGMVVFLGQRFMVPEQVFPGVVESSDVFVAPVMDGVIAGISVDLFDTVEEGHIVAVMDDTIIRGELLLAESESARLQAELHAEQAQLSQLEAEQAADARRFLLDVEQARLEHLDRCIQQETDRITLQRLQSLINRQKAAVNQQVLDQITYEETLLQFETVQARVKEHQAAVEETQAQLETAKARSAAYTALAEEIVLEDALQGFMQAVKAQEARIQAISEQRKLLVLKSPIDGQIAQVLHQPGEAVLAATPLLTLTATTSQRLVAYVDEKSSTAFDVGDTVEVYSQRNPRRIVTAKVIKTSPRIEEFPLHLQTNSFRTQWGRAILIGELPPGEFIPGEAVYVRAG